MGGFGRSKRKGEWSNYNVMCNIRESFLKNSKIINTNKKTEELHGILKD